MNVTRTSTDVAIVGGGPAGLMLAHLLHRAGIGSVVIDIRTRREIETTHRAGILEQDSVRLLTESGVGDRVLRDGRRHAGIDLAFGGAGHRIDFPSLVGASVQLYPQTDVFTDLADARARDGGDVRFGVGDVSVADIVTDRPLMRFTDADGRPHEVGARVLVGCDGSRGICRSAVPEAERRQYFRAYPYAWFGILCQAPPSSEELIYNHSDRGFALISRRTESVQRMYFQCDPAENVTDWSDARIWEELQQRVRANGYTLKEGPIMSKTVLPFRSFVQETMRHGALVLAGDAAHTVPPTGAKGLNLALADVRVLAEQLELHLRHGDADALERYVERALQRVWKAQHFSYWMTTMLHRLPDASGFDVRRQVGELTSVATSRAASTYLAEGYTGWPS
ncbi:4-hydroxybenzoate 3-monooxygenase [Streptomyces beihaiensis]|uniref:4-hydroxybenzoate 3-monooxygenase n=1 Tax=Streptomyces beihaiensis TaxID=2984495 RepID=A0ABT3TNH5_9ACTN|nr:4-hydroxybenzoate 3-monooxygenase [Streptomyces beihaiensis]MCX3058584.1 4-hydroxybenzoate 3-monooxygenase [Streptomyces beihaiensis]